MTRAASRQGRKSTTAWLLPETMRSLEIFCARMGMAKERGLEYILMNTLTSDGQVQPWMQQMPKEENKQWHPVK